MAKHAKRKTVPPSKVSPAKNPGIRYADLMESLLESAGVPMGQPSPEESASAFPKFELIADMSKHALGIAGSMFNLSSDGRSSATTRDAKAEAFELMGSKLFEVQCAILDESMPRPELAKLAYGLGVLAGRLQLRNQEENIAKRIRTCAKNKENAKKSRPNTVGKQSKSVWQAEVNRLMANDRQMSHSLACKLVKDKYRDTPYDAHKATIEDHTHSLRKKLGQ